MSWQVKDEVTTLNNVTEQVNKIRDALFINNNQSNLPSSVITGGTSGKGNPIGAGNWSGLQAFQTDKEVEITNIGPAGVPTLSWDRLRLTMSNMVVKNALLGSDVKWIDGTLNNGQFIILKAKQGQTFTLKQGGNIAITSDITVSGTEFCILIFYEDVTSPDAQGNYVVHKAQGGGGSSGYDTIQDEGIGLPQESILDFRGAGVTVVPGIGTTVVNIPLGTQSPWLIDINANNKILFNLLLTEYGVGYSVTGGAVAGGFDHQIPDVPGAGFDFQIGVGIGGLPNLGITKDGLEMNMPIDMNLSYIKFQAIGIPPPPAGLEKRFLFCDGADNDKLKARTPTGIVDLEGLVTNMSNLNNSLITQDLNFVLASGATVDFDGNGISLGATQGFAGALPVLPVGYVNIKINGGNFKVAYYNP